MKRRAIIISASSDIGAAICRAWKAKGWDVYGTYRTESAAVREMKALGILLVRCDLVKEKSIEHALDSLRQHYKKWDVLVLCPGTQEPIGPFAQCDFDVWEKSFKVNFTSQLRLVRLLLPSRNRCSTRGPLVLFFAGGGTNNATLNYSAYTVSKIALIKMCELLDAEIADTRFSIIGPGWVKTKIHSATLKAKLRAGKNYQRTLDKLSGDKCTPMEKVLACCDWVLNSPREIVSGRNFSVVFDKWGTAAFEKMLTQKPDMYKLRRMGNEWPLMKR